MALVPGLVSVVFGPLNPHCFSNSCGRYPLLLFGVLRKTIAEKPFHQLCSSTASSHTPAFPADWPGRAAMGPFSV